MTDFVSEMTPKADGEFFVRVEGIEMRKECWNTRRIHIFDKDQNEIGSFERDYPNYGIRTFEPFRSDGRWYALYSPHYQKTAVMTLPECESWCEVEDDRFCPTEHFVPRYYVHEFEANDKMHAFVHTEYDGDDDSCEFTEYHPFGFVSGCVWGDDSSWKIQYLDLSEIAEKRIGKLAKFGYVEISGTLREAVVIDSYKSKDDPHAIQINQLRRYSFEDGKEFE